MRGWCYLDPGVGEGKASVAKTCEADAPFLRLLDDTVVPASRVFLLCDAWKGGAP